MYRHSLLVVAALLASGPAIGAGSEDPVRSIVNVDVMPTHHAIGAQILADYARHARQDPAITSLSLIQQSGSDNHFILETTFTSKAGHDHHVEEDYVRSFRTTLFPHLGSPWDEHLGKDIAQ